MALEIEIGPAKKPMFGDKGMGFGGKTKEEPADEGGDDDLGDSMAENCIAAIQDGDAKGFRSALKALVLDIMGGSEEEE